MRKQQECVVSRAIFVTDSEKKKKNAQDFETYERRGFLKWLFLEY